MAHTDRFLLETLIGMLDDERNDIFLHVDKKWTEFDPTWLITTQAQLYILEKRFDARWGHSSLIDVEYALFEMAYNHRGTKYEYYHLLSGADLPIKSQDYIHDFFSKNRGTEFISYWDTEGHNNDAYLKVSRYHFFMEYEKLQHRLLSILIAKARNSISEALYTLGVRRSSPWSVYKKGANWISVTSNVIQIALEQKDKVLKRFRWTRNAEEIFLQTILWHSSLRPKINFHFLDNRATMREIRWPSGANSPDTYTIRDKDFLLSSDMLFARKFSSSMDQEIIKFIAEQFSSIKED